MSTSDPAGPPSDHPWPPLSDQPPPPVWNPPPPPPGNPYALPYGYQAYTPPQTEGMAVGALIASILSWMFCPVIAAIVALALVPGARRKIESSGGRLTGLGLLTATKWVAWLNIGFAVGATILLIVLAILGAFIGDAGQSSNFSFAPLSP